MTVAGYNFNPLVLDKNEIKVFKDGTKLVLKERGWTGTIPGIRPGVFVRNFVLKAVNLVTSGLKDTIIGENSQMVSIELSQSIDYSYLPGSPIVAYVVNMVTKRRSLVVVFNTAQRFELEAGDVLFWDAHPLIQLHVATDTAFFSLVEKK